MARTGRPSGRVPTVTPALLAELPKVRAAGGAWVKLSHEWLSRSGACKAAQRLARSPDAAGVEFKAVSFAQADGGGSVLWARAKECKT